MLQNIPIFFIKQWKPGKYICITLFDTLYTLVLFIEYTCTYNKYTMTTQYAVSIRAHNVTKVDSSCRKLFYNVPFFCFYAPYVHGTQPS